MAIELPIPVPVKREERNDQAIIDSLPGQGYVVTLVRVIRDTYADGSTAVVGRRTVTRGLAALLADKDAAPLLALLPAIFDRWAVEDDQGPVPPA